MFHWKGTTVFASVLPAVVNLRRPGMGSSPDWNRQTLMTQWTQQDVWRENDLFRLCSALIEIHMTHWKSVSWLINLTHWGRVAHICISKLTIICSDNGLSPVRRQAIIWTNAEILLNEPIRTNFSEILIETRIFSFKTISFKMSSGKRRPFCLGRNVLCHLLLKTEYSKKNYFMTADDWLLLTTSLQHPSYQLNKINWSLSAKIEEIFNILAYLLMTGSLPVQWRHNGCHGVSNQQPHDCLLNCLFRCRLKTPKLRATSLCAGNSPVTGKFPAQRASNGRNFRNDILK